MSIFGTNALYWRVAELRLLIFYVGKQRYKVVQLKDNLTN